MSQMQLAKMVGAGVRSVGRWERGQAVPRSHIGSLEAVLGISLDEQEPEAEVYTDPVERAIWELDLSREARLDFIAQLRARRMKHSQQQEPPA